jgi:hypothetical protein
MQRQGMKPPRIANWFPKAVCGSSGSKPKGINLDLKRGLRSVPQVVQTAGAMCHALTTRLQIRPTIAEKVLGSNTSPHAPSSKSKPG